MATRTADLTGAALGAALVALAASMVPAQAQQQPAAQAQPAQKAAPKSTGKSAPKQPAKPKQDPATAKSLVESGIASVQAGRLDQGIGQLSSALSGGGLPSQDMARALYFRGAAYRKQSKPALAISDLTSALWLKNGLKDGERQDAQAQRSAAYREAGLPDQTPAGATAAEPRSIVAAVPGKASSTAAAPSAPAKSASSASSASTTAMTPAERRATEVAETRATAAPASATPAPSSSGSGGVGGFFGSLFGGSSAAAPKPVETASTPPPSPPQASSWATSTSDKAGAAKAAAGSKAEAPAKAASATPAKVASAAPLAVKGAAAAPAAAAAPSAAGGKFLLQVASARSRPEAEAVAQKLRQQFAADIGGRSTEISEASFGGTSYYRVKLGTFATSEEPRSLCGKLRQQGFDCLIVTQ